MESDPNFPYGQADEYGQDAVLEQIAVCLVAELARWGIEFEIAFSHRTIWNLTLISLCA